MRRGRAEELFSAWEKGESIHFRMEFISDRFDFKRETLPTVRSDLQEFILGRCDLLLRMDQDTERITTEDLRISLPGGERIRGVILSLPSDEEILGISELEEEDQLITANATEVILSWKATGMFDARSFLEGKRSESDDPAPVWLEEGTLPTAE